MENGWPEMEKIDSMVDANSRMSYPHYRLASSANMRALSTHGVCQLMVWWEAESKGTRNDIPIAWRGVMIQLNHSSLGHPPTNLTTQKNPHTTAYGLPRAKAMPWDDDNADSRVQPLPVH